MFLCVIFLSFLNVIEINTFILLIFFPPFMFYRYQNQKKGKFLLRNHMLSPFGVVFLKKKYKKIKAVYDSIQTWWCFKKKDNCAKKTISLSLSISVALLCWLLLFRRSQEAVRKFVWYPLVVKPFSMFYWIDINEIKLQSCRDRLNEAFSSFKSPLQNLYFNCFLSNLYVMFSVLISH